MFGIIVAADGNLAESLVQTVSVVGRHSAPLAAVNIHPDDMPHAFEKRLLYAVKGMLEKIPQVLVLTDLLGGTPSNIGLTMHHTGRVEILTGVNLPMLLKAILLSKINTDLLEANILIKEAGIQAIVSASEVLSRKNEDMGIKPKEKEKCQLLSKKK
jgi:PTS system mannose-specific IIA component